MIEDGITVHKGGRSCRSTIEEGFRGSLLIVPVAPVNWVRVGKPNGGGWIGGFRSNQKKEPSPRFASGVQIILSKQGVRAGYCHAQTVSTFGA